ncbi:hypothetical protein EAO27_15730 [Sphingopyxis sp. YF1]|nr:hypothetical protein EAO27_15730 [Sphingopyxis sp. YF1]
MAALGWLSDSLFLVLSHKSRRSLAGFFGSAASKIEQLRIEILKKVRPAFNIAPFESCVRRFQQRRRWWDSFFVFDAVE